MFGNLLKCAVTIVFNQSSRLKLKPLPVLGDSTRVPLQDIVKRCLDIHSCQNPLYDRLQSLKPIAQLFGLHCEQCLPMTLNMLRKSDHIKPCSQTRVRDSDSSFALRFTVDQNLGASFIYMRPFGLSFLPGF